MGVTINSLLKMPVITDKALGEVLAHIKKDDKLTAAELKDLEKLQSLPDDRFENPPNSDVWRGQTEELESLLGAKPLVTAGVAVSKAPAGISVAMSKDTRISDEEAGGGWMRVYERDLVIKIKDKEQPKDAMLQFTYGGFKVTVPIKKGESRESILSKIETRLGKQQGAFSVGGGSMDPHATNTYGISNVRTYGHEGSKQAATRIAKEDERWLREFMGSVVDPADYRTATPGERASGLAHDVTQLLASSNMSAAELKGIRDAAEKGGLDAKDIQQLERIAVQPRSRVSGKEDGEAYGEMASIRSLVGYTKPVLAASLDVKKTVAGISLEMTDKMHIEEVGEDEGGPVTSYAKKLTVKIPDGPLSEGGSIKLTFGKRDVEIKLTKGMTHDKAKEKIADGLMMLADMCKWSGSGVVAMITHA